jgi:hypothetical protein
MTDPLEEELYVRDGKGGGLNASINLTIIDAGSKRIARLTYYHRVTIVCGIRPL